MVQGRTRAAGITSPRRSLLFIHRVTDTHRRCSCMCIGSAPPKHPNAHARLATVVRSDVGYVYVRKLLRRLSGDAVRRSAQRKSFVVSTRIRKCTVVSPLMPLGRRRKHPDARWRAVRRTHGRRYPSCVSSRARAGMVRCSVVSVRACSSGEEAATIAAKERPDDAAKYRVVRHDSGVVTQCRAQGLEKASCAVRGGDGVA